MGFVHAQAMVENDSNASRTLSRSDFARFIDKFARKAHTDFHSVADFMIMLAVTDDDPSEEIALLVSPAVSHGHHAPVNYHTLVVSTSFPEDEADPADCDVLQEGYDRMQPQLEWRYRLLTCSNPTLLWLPGPSKPL